MFKKYANAVVQDPILKFADWEKMHGRQAFGYKNAAVSKVSQDQSQYILSHCTIMASCQTEPDSDFLIRETSSKFFNENQDGWTNEVLQLAFPTFVGGFNFVEHLQASKYSKGILLDSILRKVHLAPPDDWNYFCDLLVATDCAHEELCNDIRSSKVNKMSMGCVTSSVDCSYCGLRIVDSDSYCHHLEYLKGTFLEDSDGIPRRIGELCGHKSLPGGGVQFIEASWVKAPAFTGAVSRGVVADNWIGPATPYTTPIDTSKSAFSKAASLIYSVDNWLDEDGK